MTKNEDYTSAFVVTQSLDEVFAAAANPRAWWSEDIEGEAGQLSGLFYYHYQDIHRSTLKVAEVVPGRRLVWHVVQNYFNFVKDSTEWTGTDIVFEITPVSTGTELRFTHVGLKPSEECYDVCHDSWRFYLNSLRSLITTGMGQPNKGQDNANPTVVPPPVETEAPAGQNSEPVVVMTSAAAKPGLEDKVRDALHRVAQAARLQPGCIEYSVFRSTEESNVTICLERWTTEQDRDRFLASEHVEQFGAAISGAFLGTVKPLSYTVLDIAA